MKRTSDSDTWRYGGILARDTYNADEPGLLMLYGGGAIQVRQGDEVLMLVTGSGAVVVDLASAEAVRA